MMQANVCHLPSKAELINKPTTRRQVNEETKFDQLNLYPGQFLSLKQNFEKFWEYAKSVYTCFVDLEKAYDRIPRK